MEITPLNEDSPSTTPPNMKIELFEHQKRIIHNMLTLEKTGLINIHNLLFFENQEKDLQLETAIGILGDRVGSGKSLECIGLIANELNKIIPPKKIHFMSDKYVSITSLTDSHIYSPQTILIVPDHLINQWLTFLNYAPHIIVSTVPPSPSSPSPIFLGQEEKITLIHE